MTSFDLSKLNEASTNVLKVLAS